MAKSEANRMDFALLLLFYRAHGRFPNEPEEIEPGAVGRVGQQLGMADVSHDRPKRGSRGQHAGAAPVAELHGLYQYAHASAVLAQPK